MIPRKPISDYFEEVNLAQIIQRRIVRFVGRQPGVRRFALRCREVFG